MTPPLTNRRGFLGVVTGGLAASLWPVRTFGGDDPRPAVTDPRATDGDDRFERNCEYGISIGHHDTDNVIRDNDILKSGKVGILFRDESRGKDFWPNRNHVASNRITDNGGEDGFAIDVRGKTHDVLITGNVIRETRGPARRTGLRIARDARSIVVTDNRFEGFAANVVDLRKVTG